MTNHRLTRAEYDVMYLKVVEGLQNEEVAAQRFTSINTIKWQVRVAYEKLGAKANPAHAAYLFVRDYLHGED